MTKRFAQQDNRGGKSKLVSLAFLLRQLVIGSELMEDVPYRSQGCVHCAGISRKNLMPDVPVELYPMGFVVGAGVIGASIGESDLLTSSPRLSATPRSERAVC